ncbi:OB-fold domain-containing protein [Algiphilus sp.]|uniref:Zn-ribbon domain-containing OB-fold protein n=1 Tax=Algiphilus sp. TaxID=1872431 RepID=UPI001CA6403C|nr:OB-fold domain-containing protein [Algiphilus sp.]MBY8966838.1 OB-fold domain-containing protein [Algiphilus acroporae]MCI5104775.1 OB-fold domain-containing protein [Algiphilus sp.]
MTAAKIRPALEGYLTERDGKPHLLGSRCTACGTYYFPRLDSFCRNPACDSTDFEEVPLSRSGRLWSYTNAAYQPPAPYIPVKDPYEPFAIAAVELEREGMIVLGQCAEGIAVEDLRVGTPMELIVEPLFSDDEGDAIIWKWKPQAAGADA